MSTEPIDLTTANPRTVTPEQVRDALWRAILNKGAEVAGKPHGRDQAYYSTDGMSCRTTFRRQCDDGMWDHWEITADYYPRHIPSARTNITVSHTQGCSEAFWDEIVAEGAADRMLAIVIDGYCYTVEPDSRNPGHGDGFGGRRHDIEWVNDGTPTGETFTTRNLWARGVVPPPYRDRLKDNARWATTTA